jgi:ribosomal protein L7Ae-like RNA K-turn-binding protein
MCSDVTVEDVIEFFKSYPNMPIDQIKTALRIGIWCGCCERSDCLVIGVYFDDVMNKLIKAKSI